MGIGAFAGGNANKIQRRVMWMYENVLEITHEFLDMTDGKKVCYFQMNDDWQQGKVTTCILYLINFSLTLSHTCVRVQHRAITYTTEW